MVSKAEVQAGDVLLATLVEIGGLAVVVTVAGIDEDIATILLYAMMGIFLLWMVMHPSQVQGISNIFTNAQKAVG